MSPFTALLIISLYISYSAATTYTDWQSAFDTLQATKALWQSNGINSYAYRWHGTCFCEQCYIAPKYAVINGRTETSEGNVSYIEFDEHYLQSRSWVNCDAQDLAEFSNGVEPIESIYDAAIAHAQRGLDANCNDSATNIDAAGDMICGGSITFTYDDTLFYPKELDLAYGPFISDVGTSYSFNCLTILSHDGSTDESVYSGTCTNFTFHADHLAEDNCFCPDVMEPYCCPDGNTYSNDCVAECNGFDVADCAQGACSPFNTPAPVDVEPDNCFCPDVIDPYCCPDGNTHGNDCFVECAGFEVADCAQGECVPFNTPAPTGVACDCDNSFKPYCCSDGETYSNKCYAECVAGFDAATQCEIGACSGSSQVLKSGYFIAFVVAFVIFIV